MFKLWKLTCEHWTEPRYMLTTDDLWEDFPDAKLLGLARTYGEIGRMLERAKLPPHEQQFLDMCFIAGYHHWRAVVDRD